MNFINLRNKTNLILGVTFIIFFVFFVALAFTIAIGGLNELESHQAEQRISQVRYAFVNEENLLEGTVRDWAWWDDPYLYATGGNPDFIADNIRPDSMAPLNVHLVVLLDRSGSVLHSVRFPPDGGEPGPVPEEVFQAVRSNPAVTNYTGPESGSGLVLLPEGPAILAFAPILNNNAEGEAAGTLIMGRYLNYGQLDEISRIIGNPVTSYWIGDGVSDGEQRALLDLPDIGREVVKINPGGSNLTGYMRLTDLNGRNVLLGVEIPRDLHTEGMGVVLMMLAGYTVFAFITILSLIFILDRLVLRRVQKLTDQVANLGPGAGSGNPRTPPAVLSGNDELAQLESVILSKQEALLISEDRLRAFIDALHDPAMLLSSDGTVLLANKAVSKEMNMSPESLSGLKLGEIYPDGWLFSGRNLTEVLKTKRSILFEEKRNGRHYFVSGYPVTDKGGDVVQVAVLTVDTTEHKKIETALAMATRKITVLDSVILDDVRSKMFGLQGYLNIIDSGTEDPQLRSYIGRATEMAGKIQFQLMYAKQYRDMGAVPPVWQSLNQVVLYALSHVDTLSTRTDFAFQGIELYADALLENAFLAIFTHALRDRAPATWIRGTYRREDKNLVIVIEDDGMPVSPEEKEKIFERPAKSDQGLGLFLAREILSLTDMTIRETGGPGEGGRFEILVPEEAFRFSGESPGP
ncbi:MAG: PAS domain-containing protein [Methanoregulaceae archaeon]|nr:PAS domain-containing protein [Methanoregulaceae archaeon]